MDTLMTFVYLSFGLLGILALVLLAVLPYAKLIYNKWKLRILERRGALTAFIAQKNGTLTEHIVRPDDEKFTVKDATYILNPKKAFLLFGHRCYMYEANNPEPKNLIFDERTLRFVNLDEKGNPTGKDKSIDVLEDMLRKDDGSLVAAQVIDGKTFTNLLNRAYAAGMAFANRNKNFVLIMLFVLGGVVLIAAYLNYQHTSDAIAMSQAVWVKLNQTASIIQ
jgi:hypothetical protein